MVVIKVTYGEDIRRISIDENAAMTFKDLTVLLRRLYRNTLPAGFEIKYLDDENDKVTISTERELADALAFAKTTKQPLLRVVLSEPKIKPVPTPAPTTTGAEQSKSAPAAATSTTLDLGFNPAQLLAVIDSALSSPEVQQTINTVHDTFTTCVDQAVREGLSAAHYVQQHPQFSRAQHLLTERLPQAIQNDFHSTLPRLISDIQNIFANISVTTVPCPPPAPTTSSTPPVRHHAICDSCDKGIVGIRYKCANCLDYDLCEACEAKTPGVHDPAHNFVKLRSQLPFGMEFMRVARPSPASTSPMSRASRCPYLHPQQHHTPQEQPTQEEEPEPEPVATPDNPFPFRRQCMKRRFMLSARFVSDVSIPDGTTVASNAPFDKVWRLRNDGVHAWPEGTTLAHIFGPNLASVSSVSVPALPAGEEVDIAVEMTAPAEPGHYTSNWRLTGPRGYKFGHRVWADIVVAPQEEEEAAEEEKPVATPVVQEVVTPVVEEPVQDEEGDDSSSSEEEFEVLENVLPEVEPVQPAQPEPVQVVIEATPPSEEDNEEEAVKQVLAYLAQMGFQDRALNKRILLKNKGNVLATVHQLLDM